MICTHACRGGYTKRPFTLRSESAVTALWVIAALTVVSVASLIAPPFRRTAFWGMAIPSVSASPGWVQYRKYVSRPLAW